MLMPCAFALLFRLVKTVAFLGACGQCCICFLVEAWCCIRGNGGSSCSHHAQRHATWRNLPGGCAGMMVTMFRMVWNSLLDTPGCALLMWLFLLSFNVLFVLPVMIRWHFVQIHCNVWLFCFVLPVLEGSSFLFWRPSAVAVCPPKEVVFVKAAAVRLSVRLLLYFVSFVDLFGLFACWLMILLFLVWFPKEPLLVLAALPTPPLCPLVLLGLL